MKILQFTNTFFPTVGGAEFVVHYLANELSARGHSCTVLAPFPNRIVDGLDIRYRIVRYRPPVSKRFGVRQLLLPLLKLKALSGYDLLHCHNAYPSGYVAASLKRIFPRLPIVVTCHGTDIMASERLRQNSRLNERIQRSIGRADVVTAISQSMAREIEGAGVRRDAIRLIPNGVDVSAFQRDLSYGYARPFIFSMGSFRRRKGFDVLLRAMKIVTEKNQWLDLLIAGDGIESRSLRALHADLGLGERVQFLGNVFGDEKIGLYRGCEFFVCPSRWEEPFGLINLEAMAAGKVSVASRVGGIPDVICDGENGVLVDKEEPEQLAEAILKLHGEPERRQRLERRAVEVVKGYEWSVIVDRYEGLFQELLNV